jgi:hypothetical protein
LAITKLGSHQLFLEYDWIRSHNPLINWQTGSIDFDRCLPKFNCKTNTHSMTPWARAVANISAEITAAKETVKEKKTWKEIVPQYYHQYETVFTKDSFDTHTTVQMIMGPCHRPQGQCGTNTRLQNLSTRTRRTGQT